MRLRAIPAGLPAWPPVLATRGEGARSTRHAHHAMHLLLALDGSLAVETEGSDWRRAAGVLTAPDVAHAIDAVGVEILLVFVDPESAVGTAMRGALAHEPVLLVTPAQRTALATTADPLRIMLEEGATWLARAARILDVPLGERPPMHPRVRRALRLLKDLPNDADLSLATLAEQVGLSPSRLMHAFTESIGLPLRPYITWLRLQRSAAAIARGSRLTDAALAGGFSDAAHMTRTFRRMLGMPPSELRPR